MTNAAIKDGLLAQLDRLPHDLQLRALDFARTLYPKGVDGKNLLRFEVAITADDLRLMAEAIEENFHGGTA